MTDAAFLILGLICGLPIGWSLRSRNRDLDVTDKRLDRAIAALDREAHERGRLSKRLAQAETKIMRLHRYINPVSGAVNPND